VVEIHGKSASALSRSVEGRNFETSYSGERTIFWNSLLLASKIRLFLRARIRNAALALGMAFRNSSRTKTRELSWSPIPRKCSTSAKAKRRAEPNLLDSRRRSRAPRLRGRRIPTPSFPNRNLPLSRCPLHALRVHAEKSGAVKSSAADRQARADQTVRMVRRHGHGTVAPILYCERIHAVFCPGGHCA